MGSIAHLWVEHNTDGEVSLVERMVYTWGGKGVLLREVSSFQRCPCRGVPLPVSCRMYVHIYYIPVSADVHANRPHYGQQMVAGRLRALLDSKIHPSEIRG